MNVRAGIRETGYVVDPRRNGHQKEPKTSQKETKYAPKGNDGFKKGINFCRFCQNELCRPIAVMLPINIASVFKWWKR